MRGSRWWSGTAAAVVLAVSGCAAAAESDLTGASAATTSVTTSDPSDPTKAQVTVPGLGESAVETTTVGTMSDPVSSTEVSSEPVATVAPTSDLTTVTSTSTTAPPVAPVVVCDSCTVLGTSPEVAAGLTAALTTANGRATLLAVDATGTARAAINVPYGVGFPAPADGRLACVGGLCVVVATTPDASAVLSVFALESDGWTDLSGDSGFISATPKGMAVAVDGSLGVAIQISDGNTTVWTVLVRQGAAFTTLGCTPDADAPDLAALSLTSCLS